MDGSDCAWEIRLEGRLVEQWGLWSSENWLVERLVDVLENLLVGRLVGVLEIGWEYVLEIGWGDGWEIV